MTIALPDEPVQPKQKQITVNDATEEAIGDVMFDNPKRVFSYSDELASMILGLDKYSKGGKGGQKARFMSCHNGAPWKISRSSNRKRNISIPHAYLSIFGGIQPDVLSNVFDAEIDIHSGNIPRYLFIRAVADRPTTWSEVAFSEESNNLLKKITEILWEWDVSADGEGEKIYAIEEAKTEYIQWFNLISKEAFIAQNASLFKKLQAHAEDMFDFTLP